MLDVTAYCARIGYTGPHAPRLAILRQLHRAHLLTVPFENLDIALGRPIQLDETTLFEKIVRQQRGGFCYELNGLFAALLRQLGFQVSLLSAGVYSQQRGQFGEPFDHLALHVDLEQPWLVDVGFGDSFRTPLALDTTDEQTDLPATSLPPALMEGVWQDRYRLTGTAQRTYQRRNWAGDWRNQYQFTLQPYTLSDFAERCHFHQTSPESGFTRGSVCSIATPAGRVTVTPEKLTVTESGTKHETPLLTNTDYRAALRAYCGVRLD